jgi:hypothetical protein
VAVFFPLVVLIGFGQTYYLRGLVGGPPVKSLLVHAHGVLMTAWIGLFVTQVFLIRRANRRLHMTLGRLGLALAGAIAVVGFFTAAASAKFGSTSSPPDVPPLAFFIVPLTDLVLFLGLFGAAFYFRRRAAEHKRLMLLTVLNFLPPALARFPIPALRAFGPLVFFGVPALLTIGLVAYDTRRTGRLNRAFVVGALVLIASYPLRIVLSGTPAWLAFATWVTSWAA